MGGVWIFFGITLCQCELSPWRGVQFQMQTILVGKHIKASKRHRRKAREALKFSAMAQFESRREEEEVSLLGWSRKKLQWI